MLSRTGYTGELGFELYVQMKESKESDNVRKLDQRGPISLCGDFIW